MAENFKLIFDVKDFKTFEDADAHFEAHWEGDNPEAARAFAASGAASIKEAYEGGGAHYRDGRWHLIRELQVINYTKFKPETPTPGADNLLTKCPQCGETAHQYPLGYPAGTVYLHLLTVQDGRKVEIARHVVLSRRDGVIDASDVSFG